MASSLKALLFLVGCLCLAAIATAGASPKSRLIEFDEHTRKWMAPEEVDALAQARIKFMDVTDHPALKPQASLSNPSAIPARAAHQELVDQLLPRLSVAELYYTVSNLSAFYTRYYTTATGVQAAQYLFNAYSSIAQGHANIEVELFEHSWAQPSVIARIRGSSQTDNYRVILGGHEDSIHSGATGRAPGADDDASGSSVVLEIFRVLVQSGFRPERTLEFHAYAAEEVGLKGSQAIASYYQQQGVQVAGMMQMDMTGYVAPGNIPVIGLVQDYVSAQLTSFASQLVNEYANIDWVPTKCGYGCSDHASWTKAGYPSCFPFEGPFRDSNPNIHTAYDTLAELSMEHALEFARLGLSFAVEMSFATA